MDNAPVHDKRKLEECTTVSKQAILFNAPYTPDLNPIEMFFARWKHDVQNRVKEYPGDEAFFEILKESVESLRKDEIKKLFRHTENVVFPKVIQKEDM